MVNFFITSQGRTGTKWLAWLLNNSPTWTVLHEYFDYRRVPQKYGLVSMTHKHLVYHDMGVRKPEPGCE